MGRIEAIANMGNLAVLLFNILAILVVGIIGTIILVKLTERILKNSDRVDGAIAQFIISIVKAACIVIIIAVILQLFGVATSTIVAVLGAAGAALALALKDSLANIAGGVMIIVTNPFKQGDLISVGEDRGRVEHIDLFLTTLRTLDCRTITIPNGIINTSVVYNESNMEYRRVDCQFPVAIDTDVVMAKDILMAVCEADPIILQSPEPKIGVVGNDDRGLILECNPFCRPEDYWDAEHYINETVKLAFEEAGIEFIYPHLINLDK